MSRRAAVRSVTFAVSVRVRARESENGDGGFGPLFVHFWLLSSSLVFALGRGFEALLSTLLSLSAGAKGCLPRQSVTLE